MRWLALLLLGWMGTGLSQARVEPVAVPLSPVAAETLWQDFQNRQLGQWESEFSLQIKNAQKEKRHFQGSFRLKGDPSSIASYLKIKLGDGKLLKILLLLKEKPQVFLSIGGEEPQLLKEEDYLKPLLKEAQLTLKAWDLLMPFLTWKELKYLKPDRVSGRPAEWFSLKSKSFLDGKLEAHVALDPYFKNLLKVQSIHEGKSWRCLTVRSFQKAGSHFFVKEIRLRDTRTREELRLRFLRPTTAPQKARYFKVLSFVDAH